MECAWIIPKPSSGNSVHGKIVFHEISPWSQKGWGLLIEKRGESVDNVKKKKTVMNHVINFKANHEKFSLLSSCVLEKEKQNSFLFSMLNHWYGISTIHNTFFLLDKIITFIKLKANQEHCKHSWMRIDAMSAGTANIFMFNILNFSFSIHEEGKD